MIGPVKIALGGRRNWDPLKLGPLADYLAQASDVTQSGTVSEWRDRGPFNNKLEQSSGASRPDWEATGWSATSEAVQFDAAPFLISSTGTSLPTVLSGNNTPFSIVSRVQLQSTGDQTICAWDNPSGSAQSIFRIDNAGTGRLRYVRQADGGVPNVTGGTTNLGTTNHSLSMVYDGSGVRLFIDGNVDAAVSGLFALGVCTFTRFRLGTGPGAIDALNGRVKHLNVGGRAYSDIEVLQHHAWASTKYP